MIIAGLLHNCDPKKTIYGEPLKALVLAARLNPRHAGRALYYLRLLEQEPPICYSYLRDLE